MILDQIENTLAKVRKISKVLSYVAKVISHISSSIGTIPSPGDEEGGKGDI